jgi:hypothetical protein
VNPGPLYTADLMARVIDTLGKDARRLVAELYRREVGLLDLTRRAAMVDERVYGAALERAHAAERRAPAHRLPPAAVWRGLLQREESAT